MTKFYGVPNASGTLSLKGYTESDECYDRIPLSAEELSSEPFNAYITAVDYYRGRSSAGYEVIVEGHPIREPIAANMSLDRFLDLLGKGHAEEINGKLYLEAIVKFVKKGQALFVEVAR